MNFFGWEGQPRETWVAVTTSVLHHRSRAGEEDGHFKKQQVTRKGIWLGRKQTTECDGSSLEGVKGKGSKLRERSSQKGQRPPTKIFDKGTDWSVWDEEPKIPNNSLSSFLVCLKAFPKTRPWGSGRLVTRHISILFVHNNTCIWILFSEWTGPRWGMSGDVKLIGTWKLDLLLLWILSSWKSPTSFYSSFLNIGGVPWIFPSFLRDRFLFLPV